MKTWQEKFEQLLGAPEAPPVLTRDLVARFACSANRNCVIPVSSLTYWLHQLLSRSKLRPVKRGLYLNGFRSRPALLADAIPWFYRDAVVSLNTVLGDAGILNNPSTTLTAVVPIDNNTHPPARLGRSTSKAGRLHFFGIPRRILQAGIAAERLEQHDRFEHPRATPEKALIDWLYLGSSQRSKRSLPPPHDIDTELLHLARLRRLAAAAGLTQTLERWLNG